MIECRLKSFCKVPPIFKIPLKNYFTSIPSDQGLGTQNPRSLGIKTIFAIFRIVIFFKITSFFCFFLCRNLILMIKSDLKITFDYLIFFRRKIFSHMKEVSSRSRVDRCPRSLAWFHDLKKILKAPKIACTAISDHVI